MRTLALIMLLVLLPFSAGALDVPPLKAHINDYAHMFSARTAQEMERTLADFETKESTQIAVLTVPTLAGENLEEYSIKVAEAWKIGLKGLDSGAILLIVEKERKIRIEVGRGLEGRLTDLVSGQIIRNEITPRFKTGDYDGGLTAALAAVMSAVKGEYGPQKQDVRHARKSAPPIFGLLIFLFVALIFLGSMSKVLGGIAGAVGLPVAGHIASSGLPLIMLAGLGVVGCLIGLIVSLLFGGNTLSSRAGGRGRPPTSGGFWGGFGGGGFGGFGGGSGDGGGGGFSGGGGSFGGGGSSGDY
jgi:uncharacterized protein